MTTPSAVGEMTGGGFRLHLTVGAPVPYGETSGDGFALETGASPLRRATVGAP